MKKHLAPLFALLFAAAMLLSACARGDTHRKDRTRQLLSEHISIITRVRVKSKLNYRQSSKFQRRFFSLLKPPQRSLPKNPYKKIPPILAYRRTSVRKVW